MIGSAESGARGDCQRYSEIADIQRIAFVTGMVEMFDVMLRYIGPGQRDRFEAMSEFAKKLDTTAITKILDEYIAVSAERQQFAANGTFLLALDEASGFDKKR